MRATASATEAGRTTTALSIAGQKPAGTVVTAATITRITIILTALGSLQATVNTGARKLAPLAATQPMKYPTTASHTGVGLAIRLHSTAVLKSAVPVITLPTSTPATASVVVRGQTTATPSTGALSPAPVATRTTSMPTIPIRTATANATAAPRS